MMIFDNLPIYLNFDIHYYLLEFYKDDHKVGFKKCMSQLSYYKFICYLQYYHLGHLNWSSYSFDKIPKLISPNIPKSEYENIIET